MKLILTLLSSQIFGQYFSKFSRIAHSDLGFSDDPDEDSRRTLLYMMATLSASIREKKLENGERLEDAIYYAYKICYRLNITPHSLKTIHSNDATLAAQLLIENMTKNIAEPWKSSFLAKHQQATSLNINHTKELYTSLLRAHTQHEVLHTLIRAPFNQYGEVFTVVASNILGIDSEAGDEWKQYSNIIIKSKFIQVDWKEKFFAFKDGLIKDNKAKELKQELAILTESILSSKDLKPSQIKPFKYMVP